MKTGSAREHRRSVLGPPSTKGCRPTGARRSLYWLAPSTGLWYFALLAAFAVNLFVWLRLMRQAELQTSAGATRIESANTAQAYAGHILSSAISPICPY